MKVYHGSTAIIRQPLAKAGRRNLDFSQGFYVTDLREQAVYWANRPLNDGRPHWQPNWELPIHMPLKYFMKQIPTVISARKCITCII